MSFEEDVNKLSKSIYTKARKIVRDNKENDDKYYDVAFLKYKDEKYDIRYAFRTDELFIKCDHPVMNFEIYISKKQNRITIHHDQYDIIYDSLPKRIEYVDTPAGFMLTAPSILESVHELNNSERRLIIKMCEVAQRVINKTEYDKDNTQSENNLNLDMSCMLNECRDLIREKRLEQQEKKVYESVTVAVDWIARMLKKKNKKSINELQITIFKDHLTDLLMNTLNSFPGDYSITMINQRNSSVIPSLGNEILLKALNKAEIDGSALPYGMQVIVTKNNVNIMEEENDIWKNIYSSKEYVDIDGIKAISDDYQDILEVIDHYSVYQKRLDEVATKSLNKMNDMKKNGE